MIGGKDKWHIPVPHKEMSGKRNFDVEFVSLYMYVCNMLIIQHEQLGTKLLTTIFSNLTKFIQKKLMFIVIYFLAFKPNFKSKYL